MSRFTDLSSFLLRADPCASVKCPAATSTCQAGSCVCLNGFGGAACNIAPSITQVKVKSQAGAEVTTLKGGESVAISWVSAGSMSTMSISLVSAASAL